jgi:DNA replication and repair protein RecF
MRLARLQISHVRNLTAVDISLVEGLNLFVGANGAGKTSLLEAVYLLARGRSFRTSRIGSVIARGTEALVVHVDAWDEVRGVVSLGLQKRRDNVAEARIDGAPQRQQSRVAELLPLQLLLPDGAELVLGAPNERRKFLDWGMFHVEPRTLITLRDYQRALRQRNVLLKSARGRPERLPGEAGAWTEKLAEIGEAVDALRQRYVEDVSGAVAQVLAEMAPSLEITMSYYRGWAEGVSLLKSFGESLDRDVKFGATQAGPHRADLRLRTTSEAAADALSRGQAKALAMALRLAQAQHTASVAGRRSLFLVDDLGAELDRAHSGRFFSALQRMECQVLATATSDPGDALEYQGTRAVFHVEHGRCVRTQ